MKIKLKYFLSCVLILGSCLCFHAQNRKIDSLLALVKTDKEDTTKVKHLNRLCSEFLTIKDYEEGIKYGTKGLDLGKKLNYKKGMGNSNNTLGIIYMYQGKNHESLQSHETALKIRKEIKDKKGIMLSFTNLAFVYYSIGHFPEALKNYFEALKIKEEMNDKPGIATSYNDIASVFISQKNYPEALKNYSISLKMREEIGDKHGLAVCYNNIGLVYRSQKNVTQALKNYIAALNIFKSEENKSNLGDTYINLASLYKDEAIVLRKQKGNKDSIIDKLTKSLNIYLASLKIKEEVKDKNGIINALIGIGGTYGDLNKMKEAEQYLNRALLLSKEIEYKNGICLTYENLSGVFEMKGDYKSVMTNYKLYILYRDSLNNEETKKKTIEQSMTYAFEKKELEAKVDQDKKDAVASKEKQKQKIVTYSVSGGFILVLLLAIFIFRGLRQKQKANLIITKQKTEVENQKHMIEEKQKEILDSIHYARRIQNALITPEKYIEKSLNYLNKL